MLKLDINILLLLFVAILIALGALGVASKADFVFAKKAKNADVQTTTSPGVKIDGPDVQTTTSPSVKTDGPAAQPQ
jgi:hypothetical protein